MIFVYIRKMMFRYATVTGSAIPMLNGYRDIENAFKSTVIMLKKCV